MNTIILKPIVLSYILRGERLVKLREGGEIMNICCIYCITNTIDT